MGINYSDFSDSVSGESSVFDNSVKAYLKDIKSIPLLSDEEERVLFNQINSLKSLINICSFDNNGKISFNDVFSIMASNETPRSKLRGIFLCDVLQTQM